MTTETHEVALELELHEAQEALRLTTREWERANKDASAAEEACRIAARAERQARLAKQQAVRDVEAAEAAYVKAFIARKFLA